MGMEDLLANLKKDYLKDMPAKIAELKDFYESGNISELQNAFHKLKGSGKTYGVAEVSVVCRIYEDMCKTAPDKLQLHFETATGLLKDITEAHVQGGNFNLQEDPRFQKISA